MGFTIHIGWWIIPAAMTLATLVWAVVPNGRPGPYGDVAGAFVFVGLIAVNLAAWLIWSLLR